MKLTKRVVNDAACRATRYTIFDDEIRGFGLRIFPSGAKSWIFEYRPGEGGRRVSKKRVLVGSARDITPDEARKKAKRLLARVQLGQDPSAETAAARGALTVAEVAATFLADHIATKRKKSTHANYKDVLDRLIIPDLGSRKAKDVLRAEIAKFHLTLRGTPAQANRTLAIIGAMYAFAERRGFVANGVNPARGIERYPESRRERFLSTVELERLGVAIRDAETIGIPWDVDESGPKARHIPKVRRETIIGPHAAAALRLLIFTGARLREILHLKWFDVDLERGLLRLPDSKTGRKTVVLNAPALAVLTGLPKIGEFVIAGDNPLKPRADLKRPWALVSGSAGLKGVRLHDIRHTFASYGAGGGLGLPIIGKLLGHAQSATTQCYAHLDDDPLRKASNAIGTTLAAAMGEATTDTKIVQLRETRIKNR